MAVPDPAIERTLGGGAMHPDVAELAALDEEIADPLYGWGEWFRKDARRIRNLDSYGAEHLKLVSNQPDSETRLKLESQNESTDRFRLLRKKTRSK